MLEVGTKTPGLFELAGELLIHEVESARAALERALTGTDAPHTVSLIGLTRIDTAGAQLLVSISRTYPSVVFTGLSPEINTWLAATGLSSWLRIQGGTPS